MLFRYALAILLSTVVPVSAQQVQLTGRSSNVTAEITGNISFNMGDVTLHVDDAKVLLKLESEIVTGRGLGTCTVTSSSLELSASKVEFVLQHDELRIQVADAMTGILKINPKTDFSFTAESSVQLKSKNLSLSSPRARLAFSDGVLRITDAEEGTASPTKELSDSEVHGRTHRSTPTQVRYRQLSAPFTEFPSQEEAGQSIAALGNDLVLGGNSLRKDWHDSGLAVVSQIESKAIRAVVSTLPIRQLSAIVDDDQGLHLVRVLERTESDGSGHIEERRPK